MGGESEGEGKQENEAKKKVYGLPHREVGGRGGEQKSKRRIRGEEGGGRKRRIGL